MIAARQAAVTAAGQPANEPYTLQTTRAVARAEMKLLRKWNVITANDHTYILGEIRRLPKDEIDKARRFMRDQGALNRAYYGILRGSKEQLVRAGIQSSDIPDVR